MAELSESEVRCANCGAAVYAGAEWCNLCFSPVNRPAPEAAEALPPTAVAAAPPPLPPAPEVPRTHEAPPESEAPPVPEDRPAPFWPCPLCGTKNPIELDSCGTCATPFATMMRHETDRPTVDPSVAFTRSLLYPGLGHAKLGLSAEGFARGALFTILVVVTLLIAVAGASSGLLKLLLATFGAGTLGVYFLTATEARRIAEGGRPIVSTRTLLWATVGVLMGSIALIVFVMAVAPTQ